MVDSSHTKKFFWIWGLLFALYLLLYPLVMNIIYAIGPMWMEAQQIAVLFSLAVAIYFGIDEKSFWTGFLVFIFATGVCVGLAQLVETAFVEHSAFVWQENFDFEQ